MEVNTFIERLNALVEQEDIIAVGRDVNELRTAFEDYLLEETRKFQVAQLTAEDNGETFDESLDLAPLKESFYAIYNAFREKRRALIDEIKATEAENLRQKRQLIQDLKKVVENEENIGAAFSSQKEINEKWKNIGPIPRDKRQEVQQEYSRLLEDFFYNISIYKEIKAYDYKKNQSLKEEVIQKLQELLKEENIKTVEAQVKALQDNWDDIGPTEQEAWENLKTAYWDTVKAIYDKIRSHYDALREQQKENILLKNQLIEKVSAVFAKDRDSAKAWNEDTKEIIAIQEEWKTIGFGPKKENELVWKEFRGICDAFFEAKSVFFEGVHEVYDKVAEQKQALIEKAEQLKDNTDWKNATAAIIQLQKEWKKLGSAGQRNENRLWKAFRSPIDAFFAAKEAHYKALDAANEENLKKKEELIEEIEKFELPSEKTAVIAQLKQFAQSFAEIGHVPIKQKDSIYQRFKKALDAHYQALKLEGQEKENVMFQAKLETLKSSPNASALLEKEKQFIRKKIDEVKQAIIQYENNLGFFSQSKGANALKDEVTKKIAREKEYLVELKQKLKAIPNE